MDFLILLLIIFIPVGFFVKFSDVSEKMEREEELNAFENFILNLAIGLIKTVTYIIKFMIEGFFPFMVCFIPLIVYVIPIVIEFMPEIVPFAFFIAFVISVMIVGVLKLIFTREKKE